MILTLAGLALMIGGIIGVVIQAGSRWSWKRAAAKAPADDKAKISYTAAIMIAVGAVMVMIGTSGSPPEPTPPQHQTQ